MDSDRLVGLFSGGKDSLVACHTLWKQGLLNEILYCKTGIGLVENFEYVLKTCNKYGWKLNVETPEDRFSYENFVRRFGFPHAGIHSTVMGHLKWFSMRRFAKNKPCVFVSGVRRNESKRRLGKHKDYVFNPEPNITFMNPIFDWSTAQVWEYINDNSLEICPVYKTLHLSGDCLCGSFAESHESRLITMFHPELAEQIKSLERKYGGSWGNDVSVSGASQETKLESFICSECRL